MRPQSSLAFFPSPPAREICPLLAVSPYLKSLTLVAANKLVHLFEVFSTPKFVLANEVNHHLVFYLLEVRFV